MTVNNGDTEPASELRNGRSVFEHINSNFRSAVPPSQNHVIENVPNGAGVLATPVEPKVSSNAECFVVAEEKQTASSM